MSPRQYLINVAVVLDMGVNTILLFGKPHETVSTRVARRRDDGGVYTFAYRVLNAIHKNHCEMSLVRDGERRRDV